MDLARSAPLPLEREINRRILDFRIKENQGNAQLADYLWVLEAVAKVRRVEPSSWKVCSHASSIHRYWGTVQMTRQEDPRLALTSAIAEAETGLALRSDSAGLANDLVTALRYFARQQFMIGQDPESTLARAIEVAHHALKGSRLRDYLLNNLGNCLEFKADLEMGRGQDPEPTIRAAIQCLREAASLKPWVGHSSSEGHVSMTLATYQAWGGKDNARALADGLKALKEAERLNPNSYRVYLGFHKLHLLHARKEGISRSEVAQEVALARQAFDRMVALNPGLTDAAALEASLFAAEVQISTTRSQPRLVSNGIRALQTALALAEHAKGSENQVLEAAGDLLEAGADLPTALTSRVIVWATRVVTLMPWDAWNHFQLGRLLQRLGRVHEANSHFQEALRRNPNLGRLVKSVQAAAPDPLHTN